MKIEIYTKQTCGYCVQAKNYFKSKNLDFIEYTVDGITITKDSIQEKIQKLGLSDQVKTVPQIFYTDDNNKVHYIGGYSDLLVKKDALGL